MREATGFTEREYERSLEYIENIFSETSVPVKSPVAKIAKEVLLATFGWPEAKARAKAKEILKLMESKGKIGCEYSEKGTLKSVSLKPEAPLPPKPQYVSPAIPNYPRPAKTSPRDTTADPGDRNETYFFKCCENLLYVLKMNFPELVFDGVCTKSGKHRPENGQIDLQDKHGEDVGLLITARHPNGPLVKGLFIYDAKTSRYAAEKFNKNIKRFPGQENALVKKAIWADKDQRPKESVAEEVLDDMITAEIIPPSIKDKALQKFQALRM